MHLNLTAGHLAKLTALHKDLPTWKLLKKPTPKKKARQRQLQRMRPAYRGRSKLRFRGEQRTHDTARRALEIRNMAGGQGSLVEITGEPIVYREPYRVADQFGEFEETMMPGVASHLIDNADTRFLFGHDGLPLARTKSGTMRLIDSPKALKFSATIDTRQRLANDLVIAIERGDVSQMSVGFVVETDSWSPDAMTRSISRFRELLDVSAVT
jgi:HK97 family phage prohead protease